MRWSITTVTTGGRRFGLSIYWKFEGRVCHHAIWLDDYISPTEFAKILHMVADEVSQFGSKETPK